MIGDHENLDVIGLGLAALTALAGWIRSATRGAAEVRGLRQEVGRLSARVDECQEKADAAKAETNLLAEIRELRNYVQTMDNRRGEARSEQREYQERMMKTLGEIAAVLRH